MDLEDRELEALLRSMPLARPSSAMDARVMGSRLRRRSPLVLTIFGSGALAAAAALALAVTLGWFGHTHAGAGTGQVVETTTTQPSRLADDTSLMRVEYVSDQKVIDSKIDPGNTTNPNPTRQIRVKNTETVKWVGPFDNIHVENKNEEVITVPVNVD